MNVDEIRRYCLAFPETSEKLQWGDALCFKVRMKIFAVVGLDRTRLTFKCTPESFAELNEREDIRPATYLGHRNWVVLDRLDALQKDELWELIRRSYEMIIAKTVAKGRTRRKEKRAKKKKKRKGKSTNKD